MLDFDITVGDKVLLRLGELPFPEDELSALAIPEGGHNLIEDHTYIIKKDPKTGEQLYGLSYFHNRRDASAKRGAIMKVPSASGEPPSPVASYLAHPIQAMLIFSPCPFFSFFLNLLRAALLHHMDTADMHVRAPNPSQSIPTQPIPTHPTHPITILYHQPYQPLLVASHPAQPRPILPRPTPPRPIPSIPSHPIRFFPSHPIPIPSLSRPVPSHPPPHPIPYSHPISIRSRPIPSHLHPATPHLLHLSTNHAAPPHPLSAPSAPLLSSFGPCKACKMESTSLHGM